MLLVIESIRITAYNVRFNFIVPIMNKCLLLCLLFMASTCTGCHGIPAYKNAYPNYHVPKIGGQNKEYIETALKDYRSGARKHSTMEAQAGSLSDQDISDIAVYFSTAEQTKQD